MSPTKTGFRPDQGQHGVSSLSSFRLPKSILFLFVAAPLPSLPSELLHGRRTGEGTVSLPWLPASSFPLSSPPRPLFPLSGVQAGSTSSVPPRSRDTLWHLLLVPFAQKQVVSLGSPQQQVGWEGIGAGKPDAQVAVPGSGSSPSLALRHLFLLWARGPGPADNLSPLPPSASPDWLCPPRLANPRRERKAGAGTAPILAPHPAPLPTSRAAL